MRLAFISSEAYPFIKTGGLADVTYSLPKALAALGHDVRLFLPRYYHVDKIKFNLREINSPLGVPMGFEEKWSILYESRQIPNITTYFIEHDNYFGRDGLYDDGYRAFPDNAERFIFFNRGVMQAMKKLEFHPDIIHCNDWQTALVPLFRKTHYKLDPVFADSATVLTVHNAGYQGVFNKGNLYWTQLGWEYFTSDCLEFYDEINFLKAGILYADTVTTVSKKHALELQSEEYSYNLAPDFRKIKNRLHGIDNGVDYSSWNPQTDLFIEHNYSPEKMTGKKLCKTNLQKHMAVENRSDIPLLGTTSRLTYQKGIDILAETVPMLLADGNCQFVILGSGEEWLIHKLQHIKDHFPDRMGVYWGYNETLSHLMMAGLDIFIMPSRYEPCGLSQMYSLKYGTIPVVRATGGLDDSIEQWDKDTERGNGFKFHDLSPASLYTAVKEAINCYQSVECWNALQHNAMSCNFSWDQVALEYEKLYGKVLSGN